MMDTEKLEKEIRNELLHSLYEFGVNRFDNEHVKFRQRAIRDCLALLSQKSDEPIDYQALKRENFPKNYNDAYEHVLRHMSSSVLDV